MRALRKHQRASPGAPGAFVFVSERGAPLSAPGFSRMVERAGRAAKLGIKVHAHMLRHACGYALANAGHDTRALQAYLGHRNIQNTTRYTALAQDRFKSFCCSSSCSPHLGRLHRAALLLLRNHHPHLWRLSNDRAGRRLAELCGWPERAANIGIQVRTNHSRKAFTPELRA